MQVWRSKVFPQYQAFKPVRVLGKTPSTSPTSPPVMLELFYLFLKFVCVRYTDYTENTKSMYTSRHISYLVRSFEITVFFYLADYKWNVL